MNVATPKEQLNPLAPALFIKPAIICGGCGILAPCCTFASAGLSPPPKPLPEYRYAAGRAANGMHLSAQP